MNHHHRIQIGLFVVYILLATLIMITQGIGITPDRYLIVLLAGAFLIHHSKHFIHDFVPFILIIIGYDFLRGFADDINPRIDYLTPINSTKWLFQNHIPTVDLQNMFYHGVLHWYDYSASILYLLHFAMPLAFGFFLWFYNRHNFREFMLGLGLVSYLALLVYLIYPTAPPWLASQKGLIPPITKIFNVVLSTIPEKIHLPTIYDDIGGNLVAAIPSMHGGYSFLVFLYAVRYLGKWGYLFAPYFLLMWLTIIYLGEHYLLDIFLGAVFSVVAFKLSQIIYSRYSKLVDKL